jgi:uncharacterized protein (DUF2267 family)
MYNFDKFAQEGQTFLNRLANNLGHPEDQVTTARVLKSVLHVFRDSMLISEAFDFMAQLPFFLKAVFVDQWKYRETPKKLRSLKAFSQEVKAEQAKLGEKDFSWPESTEEIVKTTFLTLKEEYLSEGEAKDVLSQMSKEVQELFEFHQPQHG